MTRKRLPIPSVCFSDSTRQDPAVVSAFAEIWGTQELLASYGECEQLACRLHTDGINISLPIPNRPAEDFAPWPHVDQSPLVKGLHCVQGIVNLLPNGEQDGGLMVCLPHLCLPASTLSADNFRF